MAGQEDGNTEDEQGEEDEEQEKAFMVAVSKRFDFVCRGEILCGGARSIGVMWSSGVFFFKVLRGC